MNGWDILIIICIATIVGLAVFVLLRGCRRSCCGGGFTGCGARRSDKNEACRGCTDCSTGRSDKKAACEGCAGCSVGCPDKK